MNTPRIIGLVIASAAVLTLSGCAYDYLQRTDHVSYGYGNAVKANLEQQTIDPARKDITSTKGLGKDGKVNVVATSVLNRPAGTPASDSTGSGDSGGSP